MIGKKRSVMRLVFVFLLVIGIMVPLPSLSQDGPTELRLKSYSERLQKRVDSLAKILETLVKIGMISEDQTISDIIVKLSIIRMIFDYEVEFLSTPVKNEYRSVFYEKRKAKLVVEAVIVKDHLRNLEKEVSFLSNETVSRITIKAKKDVVAALKLYDDVILLLQDVLQKGR